MELGDKVTEQDFDDWYRKEVNLPSKFTHERSTNYSQHLEKIAPVRGYLRTTRYKLLYYRTNAQSRELKGLPARPEDKKIQEPPKFLAIHEFDTEDLDMPALIATADTEWSKRIMGSVARMETPIYNHVASYGDGKFFQE